MPLRRGLVAAACLGFAVALSVSAARAEEKPSGDKRAAGNSVLVTHPRSGCFSAKFPVTGFLLHSQEAIVPFELDGYQVAEIYAQEGDRVRANQRLVKLDRTGNPLPGQQNMPATLTLFAPAGGRIEKSSAKLGAVKAAKGDAPALFQIAASDEIDMEADLPAIYLDELAEEKEKDRAVPVKILIGRGQAGGREVAGRVKKISPVVDKITQLGHVRILLAPDNALHAGSFVSATIDAGKTCGVISIPSSAVNYGADGTTVQVVRGERIETRHVQIGRVSDTDVEIRKGLELNEVIVAHAGTTLRDGDLVTTTVEEDAKSRRTEQP